jgi:hypothetical protein
MASNNHNWGYIYEASTTSFIRRGWHKIGVTNNVTRRLKDLSAQSGHPEAFSSHNWYKFETMKEAEEIEKLVHKELSLLGLRVTEKREFFEYPSKFFLKDLIYELTEKAGYKTLSNLDLYPDHNTELDLLLPCRYFLLQDEAVFDQFCNWSSRSINMAITMMGYNDNPLLRIPWHKYFDKPDWNYRDYLRDFDKQPYLLARMFGSSIPEVQQLREKLLSYYAEDIENYFSYNTDWRKSIISP